MNTNKLFIGNLSYQATKEDLETLFTPFGEVKEVKIIEGKGFGFVEMATIEEAQKAMEGLNNTNLKNRPLKIDEAKPPKPRTGGYSNNNNRNSSSTPFNKFKKNFRDY